MKCPYCSTEITIQTDFCPNCGQSIVATDYGAQKVDEFWNEASENDRLRFQQHKDIVDDYLHLEKSNRYRTIAVWATMLLVSLAIVFGIYHYSTESSAQMARVQASLPGHSFSCTYVTTTGLPLFTTSHHYCMLKFSDDGTVSYYESFGRNDPKELKGTYQYTVNRSIGGKYTIAFSGMKFELEVTRDYEVNSISYDD